MRLITVAAVFIATTILAWYGVPTLGALRRVRRSRTVTRSWRADAAQYLDSLERYVRPLAWTINEQATVARLRRAGLDDVLTPMRVLALQAMSGSAAGVLSLVLLPFGVVSALVVAAGGWWLVGKGIDDRGDTRTKAIRRALPNLLDHLSLLVAAGMDVMGAVRHVVDRMTSGPVRDALHRLIHEVDHLGVPRAQALEAMAARTQSPEMESLSKTLIQASTLGTAVSATLRQQSAQMRTARLQRAERQGGSAAQRMALPIVLCTLPATVIVILGPVALGWLSK